MSSISVGHLMQSLDNGDGIYAIHILQFQLIHFPLLSFALFIGLAKTHNT